MHEDAGGQLLPRRQQHGRPVDGVEPQHALAEQVNAVPGTGPPPPVGLAVLAVAEGGDVVAQGVKPHVDHLAGVAGHGNAPAAGPHRRPRHREVLQAAVDEREYFVAAPGGLDPQPSAGDRLSQRFGVPGQAEEPVLLGDLLRRGLVLGAAPVEQFGGRVELLAAGAVQALVPLPAQVRRTGPPEPFHAGPVPGVATGADNVVDAQRQRVAQRHERLGVAVDELPHLGPGRLRGQHVLQRVVVGSGLEPDGLPAAAAVTGQHVGLHELEREPDVRARVHVRNRGGDIGMRRAHRSLLWGAPSACKHIEAPSQGLGNELSGRVSGPARGASSPVVRNCSHLQGYRPDPGASMIARYVVPVRLGVNVPNFGPGTNPDVLRRWACAAEQQQPALMPRPVQRRSPPDGASGDGVADAGDRGRALEPAGIRRH